MTCTHHWTVTSECPRCLREQLDVAQARLAEASATHALPNITEPAITVGQRVEMRFMLTHPSDDSPQYEGWCLYGTFPGQWSLWHRRDTETVTPGDSATDRETGVKP